MIVSRGFPDGGIIPGGNPSHGKAPRLVIVITQYTLTRAEYVWGKKADIAL